VTDGDRPMVLDIERDGPHALVAQHRGLARANCSAPGSLRLRSPTAPISCSSFWSTLKAEVAFSW
jgi:hypothetical protein